MFSQHKEFMLLWRQNFWNELSSHLIGKVLKPAIPNEVTKLKSYQVMVNHAEDFEKQLEAIG